MGKFKIIIGDITSDSILENHDLIINPTNPQMVAGSGVCGAIFKKAGVDMLENYTQDTYDIHYFSDNYKKENVMRVGDIRVTPGFNLNMDIMFVQGPKKWEYSNSLELLMHTYTNMLKEISKGNYKNILIPSLGTGVYGFKHEEVGKQVATLLNAYTANNDINIDLVLYDKENLKFY